MKSFRVFRSIRLKLNILYSLLILVAMQVVFVYFVRTLENTFQQRESQAVRKQATLLAEAVKDYLLPKNGLESGDRSAEDQYRALDEKVHLFSDNRTEVQILDANAIVRASNARVPPPPGLVKSTQPEVIQALQGAKTVERDIFDPVDDLPKKLVVQPVTEDGKVIGAVYIVSSMKEMYENLRRINQIFVSGTLIALALAAVLGFVLSRTITAPVVELTRQATAVSEGRFDRRVRVLGDDEIGQLARAFNHMTDRLKEALSSTEEEREKLESVLSNMSDGVVAADGSGRVMLMNRRAREMLRVEAGGLETADLTELLGLPRQEFARYALDGGETTVPIGELIVRVSFSPIHRRETGVTGTIAVLQDVTEQEKLEQSRREFVANVSHELRTPLTTIKSYLEALESGVLEDRELARKFLAVAASETERMIRLVHDLLQLSRLDAGRVPLVREPTDVAEMLEDVIDRFSVQSRSRNIQFHLRVDPGLRKVSIDRDQIDQVLDNLVSNALNYTADGGWIRLEAAVREGALAVSVEDNGIGIPKEDLPRVFERFYRVDKARSRSMGGTGLGLSIAREIIRAHGGAIGIESEVGKGTKVTFTIPLSEGKTAS